MLVSSTSKEVVHHAYVFLSVFHFWSVYYGVQLSLLFLETFIFHGPKLSHLFCIFENGALNQETAIAWRNDSSVTRNCFYRLVYKGYNSDLQLLFTLKYFLM